MYKTLKELFDGSRHEPIPELFNRSCPEPEPAREDAYLSVWKWWTRYLWHLKGRNPRLGGDEWTGGVKEQFQDDAHRFLVYLTGQDFGYDAEAWHNWLKEHPNIMEEREASGELEPLPPSRFDL